MLYYILNTISELVKILNLDKFRLLYMLENIMPKNKTEYCW